LTYLLYYLKLIFIVLLFHSLMNKKTLPTIKRETIDIDEIYVTQHSVIETVKKILMENK